MICVSTKDPHSLLFRQKMGGYLEDILHKIGRKRREIMVIIQEMIRLGYFLSTINSNSKLLDRNVQYTTVKVTYVILEVI